MTTAERVAEPELFEQRMGQPFRLVGDDTPGDRTRFEFIENRIEARKQTRIVGDDGQIMLQESLAQGLDSAAGTVSPKPSLVNTSPPCET